MQQRIGQRTSHLGFALIAGLAVASQNGYAQGPPQQMFQPGTSWQRSVAADGNCFWTGREPSGSTVYAWENGCNGTPYVWGYALRNPSQLDAVVWTASVAACGGTVARAWQWFDNGAWSEYVGIRDANGCAADYYSSPGGGCPANITGFYQRSTAKYRASLQTLTANPANRAAQEVAWHDYNRANLTFAVCQRQLAAAGPADYHNSR